MKSYKQNAINAKLNCHKGEKTLEAIWAHLPDSCQNLPRNIIADILNTCNAAFQQGRIAELKDIEEFLGVSFWDNADKIIVKGE